MQLALFAVSAFGSSNKSDTRSYGSDAKNTGNCCGTGGAGNMGGQGDDQLGVKLFSAEDSKLVVGQTSGVPTTIVGSRAGLGQFMPNTDFDTLRKQSAEYFTLTPADFMLDSTFNESKPLTRWGGGDNGGLFTGYEEENDDLIMNSVTSYVGDKGRFAMENGKFPAIPAPSVMHFSASSITFKKAYQMTMNSFFIGIPEVMRFISEACASFKTPGAIASPAPSCPTRNITAGEYKFSMMGVLSGSHVNLETTPADTNSLGYGRDYINVRDFKTVHYRQVLNMKNVKKFRLQISTNGTEKTVIASYNSTMAQTYDISGADLKVLPDEGNDEKEFKITLNPSFVAGTFMRNIAERKCQLALDGSHEDGKGNKITGDSSKTCLADQRGQSTATGSAPVFTPKEERTIKITIRPTQCLDRKDWDLRWNCPRCDSAPYDTRLIFGVAEKCYANDAGKNYECALPRSTDARVKDCPHWLTVGAGDNCCMTPQGGSSSWAVGRSLECEPGSCFMLDYIVPLEDQATGKRTAFGDPENVADGMSKGTYFVYDPEIVYSEQVVTIEIKTTVLGVSEAAIASDVRVQESFEEGMATTLGIPKSNVDLVQVGNTVLTSTTTTRRLAAGVELKFNVKASDVAADQIISKTKTASFKTDLVTNLKASAATKGVSAVVTAVVVTKSSSSISSKKTGNTNTEMIIGGVFGALTGVAIIAGLAYYFCVRNQPAKLTATKGLEVVRQSQVESQLK